MYPVEKPLGYVEECLELVPNETVFLLVDVYGRGFDPDDEIGRQPEYMAAMVVANRRIVVEKIKPARLAAREARIPIVYAQNYLSPGLTEGTVWRNLLIRMRNVDVLEAWREPNDALAFSKVIAPEPEDHVIRKQFFSGFFETHLDSLLRGLGVKDLVLVGFDSRICLRMTAIDAMMRNYRVITLRDCISTYEYEETRPEGWANFLALRELETFCGYSASVGDWIQACREV
jgi:nicotinamidase-related amidase